MLTLCYNILQFAIIALCWPALLASVLVKGKYRRRISARLGLGLAKHVPQADGRKPTFWLHGLSVGEITSAVPLVVGLRNIYPHCRIVVTTATESGEAVAHTLLLGVADHIIASPLDILPVVSRFIDSIRPDLYILVETDFWPNLLAALTERHIPTILVNGRISQKSFEAYRKFSFFFVPMFRHLTHFCLQTESEKEKFRTLGLDDGKLHILGNLKYDTPVRSASPPSGITRLLPANRLLLVAGSTHPGEERPILEAYRQVRRQHSELYLVLVPRKPERADEILQLGRTLRLQGRKRTENPDEPGDYLLVDTIGELVELYRHCQIAFTGGSLVAAGGHNPIEPASMSVPVLFGPHMEDFQEIAEDLLAAGGAVTVADEHEFALTVAGLLADPDRRQLMGHRAGTFVASQQGVIARHSDLIASLL